MKESRKLLINLINEIGLTKTSEMVGMTKLELVKFTNIYLENEVADELLLELYVKKIIPKKYNNCEITYDTFSGTIEWDCDWENNREKTYTYATPFWDGQNGIPVETQFYSIIMDDGETLTHEDIDFDDKYAFISWKDGFKNIESYIDWVENFYLPKVYDIILVQLENYRYYFSN